MICMNNLKGINSLSYHETEKSPDPKEEAMLEKFFAVLKKRYPRHYIMKKPLAGMLVLALTNFGFLELYRPVMAHQAGDLSYSFTMAIYSFFSALFVYLLVKLLNLFRFFTDDEKWTVLKEMLAIVIILLGMGVAIYLTGFFIETPAQRWNMDTFLDSCKNSFLIGIIPLLLISLLNFRYLLPRGDWIEQDINTGIPEQDSSEELIRIKSKLKKEELSFLPGQLIYISSDGNYTDFYLDLDKGITKMTIRNSISNIEDQLAEISFLVRTHRAFIVNLKRVSKKQGNALGYKLTMEGANQKVPVSRQKVREFDQQLRRFLT